MLHFLFSFQGRINRAKFWLVYLGSCFVAGGLATSVMAAEQQYSRIDHAMTFFDGRYTYWPQSQIGWILFGLFLGTVVAVFYALLCAIVKRLHDRGKSAWWLAFFYGAPLAGFAALKAIDWTPTGATPQQNAIHLVTFAIVSIIIWWYLVEILFLPGTKGDNKFGPDPRSA